MVQRGFWRVNRLSTSQALSRVVDVAHGVFLTTIFAFGLREDLGVLFEFIESFRLLVWIESTIPWWRAGIRVTGGPDQMDCLGAIGLASSLAQNMAASLSYRRPLNLECFN
jgi:hypothetical protein